MADFYGRMTETASRLMAKFKQGVIEYVPLVAGATEYDPMTDGDPVLLNAVARGVSSEYVDDLVSSSDVMVICSRPQQTTGEWNDALLWFDSLTWDDNGITMQVDIKMQGRIRIDGINREIIRIKKTPAAGDIITITFFVKG